MLISLHDFGAISEVIPKPGQTIEETLLDELNVDGFSEMDRFNPMLLRGRNDESVGRFVMLGRRHHKPQEEENYIADIITGMPEKHWCYGPYVIAFERNGEFVDIPSNCVTIAADVVSALVEMTTKEIPFYGKGDV